MLVQGCWSWLCLFLSITSWIKNYFTAKHSLHTNNSAKWMRKMILLYNNISNRCEVQLLWYKTKLQIFSTEALCHSYTKIFLPVHHHHPCQPWPLYPTHHIQSHSAHNSSQKSSLPLPSISADETIGRKPYLWTTLFTGGLSLRVRRLLLGKTLVW